LGDFSLLFADLNCWFDYFDLKLADWGIPLSAYWFALMICDLDLDRSDFAVRFY